MKRSLCTSIKTVALRLDCWFVLLGLAASAHAVASTDDRGVLLVCPPSLLEATTEWRSFRESQGWQIFSVAPKDSASESLAAVRRAARLAVPSIEAVVLIGDGEATGPAAVRVAAEVIGQWGPEQEIATDRPFGDLNGDGVSDAAVGRIPINHAIALRRYFSRVMRRERRPARWTDGQIHFVAGVGGFSPLVDGAIEQTAALLIGRLTPPSMGLTLCRSGTDPLTAKAAGLTRPSLAWVYLGHGTRNYLPSCATRCGVRRWGQEEGASQGPDLAVLLACYAGDFTAPGKCVAEQLLIEENGPLAVIAATRLSMPYGNTVVGARLLAELEGDAKSLSRSLSGSFQRSGKTEVPEGFGACRNNFGELLRSAADASVGSTTKKAMKEGQAGVLLAGVRPLARMLSGPDTDLDAECRDHANLYCLLGDPLVSLRQAEPLQLIAPARIVAGQTVMLKIESKYAGTVRCALARGGASPLVANHRVKKGESAVSLALPRSVVPGVYRLTVSLVGAEENRLASAGAELRVTAAHLSEKRSKQGRRR